ncbi:MAG: acyltransferase family protein [Myxococcota bacterium]|nr:acyltransferase family protein [Myxococcota bacterium]
MRALAATLRAPVSPVTGRLHLEGWDRLRVIAALDTVFLHFTGDHAFFGWGLPLFLLLSIALGVSKPQAPTTARFLERRVPRILLPWVFWAVVFVGLRALSCWMSGLPLFGWLEPSMLFYGPRIHLWFLPFILGAGLIAHRVHQLVGTSRVAPVVALGLAGGAVLLAPTLSATEWPYAQWVFSLPAIPLGFVLGRALAFERSLPRLRLTLLTILLGFVGLGLAAWGVDERSGVYAFRHAGGFGLLALATLLPNRADPITKKLTPLMLGVYILHPAVYGWIVKPAMCAVEMNHVRWLRVALAFPATMLVVWLLRKTWLKRFL